MNIDELTLGQIKAVPDPFDAVKEHFESFGYRVLDKPKPEDNGADMYVVGRKKAAKVEIKVMRQITNGGWQVPPVTPNQRDCDICAVVLPNGTVFTESMSEYLKLCSSDGYRSFTWLKLD